MDYWLSKLMYDLKDAELRARFKADPDSVLVHYPLKPEIRKAALAGDISVLQPLVNAYLLRFYCGYIGMSEADFRLDRPHLRSDLMAIFAGAFAASHGPLIVRDWDKLAIETQEQFSKNFRELGRRIAAANPDVLVVISPDHWVNFFLNVLPTVCIGVGDENDGPPEPFMATFPWKTVPGDADFGQHLLRTALLSNFDPAASYRLTLDHGFCIPLWRMELPALPRIVPIIINALQDPMPTVARSMQLGRMIADAIASYPADTRIAVLGTGGLSHSIGEPTMGEIDETFDRIALEAFAGHDEAVVATTIQTALEHTGNGSHEVRCWAVAAGAAGASGLSSFELIDYMACPEVYVGCAFGLWNAPAKEPSYVR